MTDISFDTCKCGAVVVSSATAVAALKADNERLRAALQDLVGAIADPTSQRSIPDALMEARAALTAQPAAPGGDK